MYLRFLPPSTTLEHWVWAELLWTKWSTLDSKKMTLKTCNCVPHRILHIHSHLLHTILLLLLQAWRGICHPQCLDFKPPFEPRQPLVFCKEYSKFGCCGLEKDHEISRRFYTIMDNFDHSGFVTCGKYIRSLLCQVREALTGNWEATIHHLIKHICLFNTAKHQTKHWHFLSVTLWLQVFAKPTLLHHNNLKMTILVPLISNSWCKLWCYLVFLFFLSDMTSTFPVGTKSLHQVWVKMLVSV